MRTHGWLHFFLWLLLAGLVASQIPTPEATTTVATLTLTQALFPTDVTTVTFTTTDDEGVLTVTATPYLPTTLSTIISAASTTVTYTGVLYYGLKSDDMIVAPGYKISLQPGIAGPAICFFPTSGQWSLLPRILFYLTLVFALVARRHEWLVGGALAAALAYSSLAALQVAFQVWTGKDIAELDFLSILSVLGTSCILAVPLMNWSSTIQRLGLPEEQKRKPSNEDNRLESFEGDKQFQKKKEYGSTRVVLLFWNLIVMIGFLAAVGGFALPNSQFTIFHDSEVDSITCTPSNGILDATAGQLPLWRTFWLTSEFISQNNCVDPCSTSTNANTLFRSNSELQTISMNTVGHLLETDKQSKTIQHNEEFVLFTISLLILLVPFIIIQGLLHVFLFWRSNPQKARWKIYRLFLEIRNIEMDEKTEWTAWVWLAFIMAWLFYFFASVVLLIAPVLFVMTIVAMELALYWTPQSETNAHLDQWGVFAVTILVLIAAFIARLVPEARRRAKFNYLDKKRTFYVERLKRLRANQAESMKVMPRYKKPWPFLGIFTLVGVVWETAPLWGIHFGRWIRHVVKDAWKGVCYHHHMSVEFWRKPYEKPIKRDEADAKWRHERSQAEKDDEKLQESEREKEAKDFQERQYEAQKAKEDFRKVWKHVLLGETIEGAMPGATDMSEINPQAGATIVHRGLNTRLHTTLPGLSDTSSPRAFSGRGTQSGVKASISSANAAHEEGLNSMPMQSLSQYRGTRSLTSKSQGYSQGAAAALNPSVVSSASTVARPSGRQSIRETPFAMSDRSHHDNPTSSVSTNLRRKPHHGQYQRLVESDSGTDQHQASKRRSQPSNSPLLWKDLPPKPSKDSAEDRDRSDNRQNHASQGDQQTPILSPHISSSAELEGQISRQEYGSRSPDIYMAASSTNVRAQPTHSSTRAQSSLEAAVPLLSNQPDGREQLDSTSPDLHQLNFILDADVQDPSLHYDVSENYDVAQAHASDAAPYSRYHVSRSGRNKSRQDQDSN